MKKKLDIPISPKINPFHTSCNDCIFAKKEGKTQVGCEFEKINLYKEKGVDIVEAYDDFNNEFFIINDRVCLQKRIPSWGEFYPKEEWRSVVQDQIKIKYHAIVIFRESMEFSAFGDLEDTLWSLNDQDIPPCHVTILNRSKMAASDMVSRLEKRPFGIQWRLQTFFDDNISDREAIDIVMDSSKETVKAVLYVVFESPFLVPEVFSKELQLYFVDELNHVIFAHPRSDGNGMLVNYSFHRKHAGNCFGINLEDKLKKFEPGAEEYIRDIEEICPSLKM